MSNVKGRIAVDVQFTDSTTSSGVQSLKTITLQDATEYTTGKVAIVTGTCGTAQDVVDVTFINAAGNPVSFSKITRVAFSASRQCVCSDEAISYRLLSSDGRASVTEADSNLQSVLVNTTSGTASYTLFLYGT